jgi:hypothetical protein
VANKLSAIPLTQETRGLDLARSLVPMFRVGCPLLLKTNLLTRPGYVLAQYSGAEFSCAMRSILSCCLMSDGRVVSFAHVGESRPVAATETISAADRAQQEQGQHVLFNESPRARSKSGQPAAVTTLELL